MEKINITLTIDELLLIQDLLQEEQNRRTTNNYKQSQYIDELIKELLEKVSMEV